MVSPLPVSDEVIRTQRPPSGPRVAIVTPLRLRPLTTVTVTQGLLKTQLTLLICQTSISRGRTSGHEVVGHTLLTASPFLSAQPLTVCRASPGPDLIPCFFRRSPPSPLIPYLSSPFRRRKLVTRPCSNATHKTKQTTRHKSWKTVTVIISEILCLALSVLHCFYRDGNAVVSDGQKFCILPNNITKRSSLETYTFIPPFCIGWRKVTLPSTIKL